MATRRLRRLGVCTGGGDCPGLNMAIEAIVRHVSGGGARRGAATAAPSVLGIRTGLTGLTAAPASGTMPLTLAAVHGIGHRGGTILGTSNQGSPFRDPTRKTAALKAMVAGWRRLDLDAMIVIGGDGTQNMARHLIAAGLPIIGVPKTIDNDMPGSEATIGFATAVEVAAGAARSLDNSADAHDRIMMLEVMGRDAGHIALDAGIAAGAPAILIPEIGVDPEALTAAWRLSRDQGRRGWLVVVAEGARLKGAGVRGGATAGAAGQIMAGVLARDTGADVRLTVLGHPQRGADPVAQDRLLAAQMASHAVELALRGTFGRMVVQTDGRVTDRPYSRIGTGRRLVDPKGPQVTAAESRGITFGRTR